MKTAAAALILIAAVIVGCGGGNNGSTGTAAKPPTSQLPPPTSAAPTAPAPTATTNTPPTVHRTTPQPSNPSTQPLKVGSSYKCGGSTLKTIDARGPIKVKPPVVKPGQSFTVTITAKNVHVAVVSLAGVSLKPIQSNAKEQNGQLVATLKMPPHAGCGNKLLDIEGDITAEAFVGVSD
jgi:hypothetical protein